VEALVQTARPCPVCGGTQAELLYRQRFASFSAGSIGDGYDVVACAGCGMAFASGLPEARRFAQYYADSSKYDLSADAAQLPAQDIARYADQAAFVSATVQDRATPVLDVGTAAGGFLMALRAEGFARVHGVDPSPDAVSVARESFGLDVRVGGLDAADSWAMRFGLVTYIAVLEHVLSPREQVRAVSQRLAADGYLFVSVPNATAFAEGVEAPFQEFSVEHINFFTSGSLRNLMAAEGYAPVDERAAILAFGSDGRGPVLEAVFRRTGAALPIRPDLVGVGAIRDYIAGSLEREALVVARIADVASSGDRLYVWGTGTHTLHLLESSRLAECRIEAFLDSNPHYAGATLAGRPVVAPSSLATIDAPILVSSSISQSAIADAARARFGPDVPLILLYGDQG
jgi:SAM-dependent methyltransferase